MQSAAAKKPLSEAQQRLVDEMMVPILEENVLRYVYLKAVPWKLPPGDEYFTLQRKRQEPKHQQCVNLAEDATMRVLANLVEQVARESLVQAQLSRKLAEELMFGAIIAKKKTENSEAKLREMFYEMRDPETFLPLPEK